jgi:hypothetical protein
LPEDSCASRTSPCWPAPDTTLATIPSYAS